MKIIVASANKNKIREFAEILGDGFEVLSSADVGFTEDVEETGSTFEENAYIKAKAVYDFCHLPCVADDSGLEVDFLDGAPGVYSARYAGEHGNDAKNIELLLKNLENAPDRKANFTSALALVSEDSVITAVGKTYGEIMFAPEGENGFGYDPVFYSYDLKKGFGVASKEEKNSVSHRARAIRNLLTKLQ